MSKLTGPLMSLDASGSIAGTLTYAKWKGRNYVRHLVKPANPKTPGQVSFRAMMAFLSKAWSPLLDADKAAWHVLAEQTKISDFNAFVKENQRLWTQAATPHITPTRTPTTGAGTFAGMSAIGGVRQITLTLPNTVLNDNWGLIIYRNAVTGFTPAQTDVIGVILADTNTTFTFVDTPVMPGTWYYRIRGFDHGSGSIINATEFNGTAT